MVPLLLIVLFKGKELGFKLDLRKILIFLSPSLLFQAIWFGWFANQNFFGVYFTSDLTHPVSIADPSLTFLPRIFVESAGWLLLASAVFSLVLAFSFRRLFAKTLWLDVVFAVTVLAVVGVDLGLVFGRHLLVPYVSAFKYDYVALPFVCLLAGSLADKGKLIGFNCGKRKCSVKLFWLDSGWFWCLLRWLRAFLIFELSWLA